MKNTEQQSKGLGDVGLLQDGGRRPNTERLAAFINSQTDPKRFANLLFAFCKPSTKSIPDRQKEA